MQGYRRNFLRALGPTLETVLAYISKSALIVKCKGQECCLCLQLAQFLAQPKRVSNKHIHLGLACIWFITSLCSWTLSVISIYCVILETSFTAHPHPLWFFKAAWRRPHPFMSKGKGWQPSGQESAFALPCWPWQQPHTWPWRQEPRATGPFSNHLLNEIFIAGPAGLLASLEFCPNLCDHSGNSLG